MEGFTKMNIEGIEQLKSDLRRLARHYSQNRFGRITMECGTEACQAGICLIRKIGMEEFTCRVVQAAEGDRRLEDRLMKDCIAAGVEQLGLTLLTDEEYRELAEEDGIGDGALPPIFGSSYRWPEDLRDAMREAVKMRDHEAQAEVACRALDRIDDNGRFLR